MPVKALEAGALTRLMMGSGRWGRTLSRWVLTKSKGIPRSTRIGRHCALVKYTGTDEVVI